MPTPPDQDLQSALHDCHLGDQLRAQKKYPDAITAYRRAISLNPNLFEAHNNLGIALRNFGQLDQAIAAHQHAASLEPQNPRAGNNLGIAFSAAQQPAEAILAYHRAIELNPNYPQAHHNLGKALAVLDRFDEAIAAFQRAIALNPDFASAHGDLSNALKHEARLEEALKSAQRAVDLAPDSPQAHCRHALMLLRTGDLANGWLEYEWRYRLSAPWKFPHPRWQGEPLAGRTLLLHADQGLGDTIHFIRYAPLIAQQGGRVILRCQRQLVRLLKNFPGIEQTLSEDDPLPDFDVHCPLISLPVPFKTRLETIPSTVPYLRPSPSLVRAWSRHFRQTTPDAGSEVFRRPGSNIDNPAPSLRVGLVWAGHPSHSNDANRSTTLDSFAPLSQAGDITFHSLQVGPASIEARTPPPGPNLIDLTPEITDFADTAALIDHLDLVIAVDTSTAHLAAAMGKPVWLILPHVAEWRWLIDRADTPWYPTMRLFRQPKLNDWQGAIEKMIDPLSALAQAGAERTRAAPDSPQRLTPNP